IQSAEAVHRLAERLSARIGAKNIIRLKPQENWVPEQSQTKTSALDNEDENASIPEFIAKRRPPFLLKRPESIKAIAEVPDGPPRQFLFRSLSFKVKNFKGPERIIEPLLGKNPNAEMPLNSHKIRDYYQVETQNGARFFLFRAGFYGGETAPKWYVHGGG
ncbi:MAG: DNA polymerase Y family protein, partial [Pseudomonadota bacterium]